MIMFMAYKFYISNTIYMKVMNDSTISIQHQTAIA